MSSSEGVCSEGVCSEEMCSEGVSSGRSPSMAESIISMCRRTWSQERRIGVLLRAFEPEATFTVWDCVPECIIDSHLKDAFEYHSDQRDYLLFYAVPASGILRSIRRLDGYRASPLVLKSLHFFDHQKDIDAYNFPPEPDFTEDFSESEYDEDSFISRESTLSPTPVSELDDSDNHTTTQTYNSKSEDDAELKDELVRCKPQQWIEYPETGAFEVCIAPVQQSASDVDDEASSPEPRLLPHAHQLYIESDDDLKDDEPLGANSSEPQLISPVHQSSPESDDDLKDDDEPRLLSPVHPFYTEPDEDSKDDEPIEANSPETQTFSPVHRSSPESDDSLKDDGPLEANNPDPLPPFPEVYPFYPVFDDGEEDMLLTGECPEPQQFTNEQKFYLEPDDGQRSDESFEAADAGPRPAFRAQFRGVYPYHPVFFDSDDEEDEPLREESHVQNSYLQPDDSQKADESFEAYDADPRPAFRAQFRGVYPYHPVFFDSDDEEDEPLTEESHVQNSYLQPDDSQKADGSFEAYDADPRPAFRAQFRGVYPYHPVFFDSDDEEDEPLTEESHVQNSYLQPDDSQKANESFEAYDADPRPAFRAQFRDVYPYHPVFFDSDDEEDEPLTEESQVQNSYLQPDDSQKADESFEAYDADPRPAFRAQFRGVYPYHSVFFDTDDEEDEPLTSPSSEPRTPSPVRCQTPEPESGDQESPETCDPKPQRIVPVHQSHPRLYEPEPRLGLDHEGPESLEIWNLYY